MAANTTFHPGLISTMIDHDGEPLSDYLDSLYNEYSQLYSKNSSTSSTITNYRNRVTTIENNRGDFNLGIVDGKYGYYTANNKFIPFAESVAFDGNIDMSDLDSESIQTLRSKVNDYSYINSSIELTNVFISTWLNCMCNLTTANVIIPPTTKHIFKVIDVNHINTERTFDLIYSGSRILSYPIDDNENVSWDNCYRRKFLNTHVYDGFSEIVRDLIDPITSTLGVVEGTGYGSKDVTDNVTILTAKEVGLISSDTHYNYQHEDEINSSTNVRYPVFVAGSTTEAYQSRYYYAMHGASNSNQISNQAWRLKTISTRGQSANLLGRFYNVLGSVTTGGINAQISGFRPVIRLKF